MPPVTGNKLEPQAVQAEKRAIEQQIESNYKSLDILRSDLMMLFERLDPVSRQDNEPVDPMPSLDLNGSSKIYLQLNEQGHTILSMIQAVSIIKSRLEV